jgi:4-amino-4-deoxy-L-arabinose transferase-like glycosyltransferase
MNSARDRIKDCRRKFRRLGLLFAAATLHHRTAPRLALVLIVIHIVAWTVFFTVVTAGQTPHADSLETYAWGRIFSFGYGKHPPLSGWIACLWFEFFPASDWAMYLLAMTIAGATIWCAWVLAIRVAEPRRAMLATLLLLIYPTLNMRASSVTPDTLQAPLFVLAVLVYLIARERRSARWGAVLGLVCAAAVLTKYWALLVIGAIGTAALVDAERSRFFRSPAPYAAAAAFLIVLIPHAIWLVQSGFAPIEHARKYLLPDDVTPLMRTIGALRHHAGMLLAPVLILAWSATHPRLQAAVDMRDGDAGARRLIWVITAFLIVVPPVAAVALGVHFVTDWGIPLYTLVPLAIVSAPRLGVPLRALIWTAAAWLVFIAAAVAASPLVAAIEAKYFPDRYDRDGQRLAAEVTRLWHQQAGVPLPMVAGPKPLAVAVSFYSPDHPAVFTNFDRRIATWIDPEETKRSGFAAICIVGRTICEAKADALISTSPGALTRTEVTLKADSGAALLPRRPYTISVVAPAN